ncbi:lytic transglycosylase domain-containing protein [Thiohalophilus thiocyanatoxydans]|uniref:Transglycosylase-like protein with SLT domain n=1 Tax=Thiohalophilus thiocyanatoxydans TaxID=381308 RepID=A0A4R8ITL6_9GAMM|nr:lytic transglycosylase domain-containing protein [Thiohalophilus thiocyanatoxydans]TDY01017.1 transglycosylase-like protein with SLT domain [Thiohalophilus thiocyanatoxydans]
MKQGVTGIMLSLGLLWATGPAQAAEYYLYQLPDGSRTITDHPKLDSDHKLVCKSRNPVSLERYAAGHNSFNTAPAANYLRFENIIYTVANQHQIDAALIKAVIHTESFFNPNATSHKGASGLMQLMPATAERYGVTDLYSPQQNIEGGVRYLRDLMLRYPEQIKLTLAAYNAGEEAVDHYQGIPPYPETRKYVKKVLEKRAFYSNWP